jgi:hypothetical protein
VTINPNFSLSRKHSLEEYAEQSSSKRLHVSDDPDLFFDNNSDLYFQQNKEKICNEIRNEKEIGIPLNVTRYLN